MEPTERLHALDAVRAFALLLGIVLHATLSFVPGLGALGWPIVDNTPSVALGVVFFVIHVFRMTLFFVIAGYFARVLWHRRGAGAFWRDRARRILLPMIVAWPLLMPLLIAAMYWASVQAGKPLVRPTPPAGTVAPFPLAHLWFLYVLCWLYVGFLGARALIGWVPGLRALVCRVGDAVTGRITSLPLGALVLAIPVASTLYWREGWLAWGGIPSPDNSLLVNLPAFVGFGTAFAFGWMLQRQRDALAALAQRWGLYAAAAIGFTAVAIHVGGIAPGDASHPLTGAPRVAYVVAYCSASWCWSFAFIGAALRFLSGASPLRRYLADASYWLYLVHLPLVFALQAAVIRWGLHWSLKFAIVMGVTLLVSTLSYHWLVRSTRIGALLNGHRYPRMPLAAVWRRPAAPGGVTPSH